MNDIVTFIFHYYTCLVLFVCFSDVCFSDSVWALVFGEMGTGKSHFSHSAAAQPVYYSSTCAGRDFLV